VRVRADAGLLGPDRRSSAPVFTPRRTSTGAATVLTTRRPYVLLDRLQSGVGTLTVRAAWDTPEHARLGCGYRLRSGRSTIARTSGAPRADEPLTLALHDGVPVIRLDLLRCRRLDRLIVFAVLQHHLLPPSWHGTLQVSTYGGALADVPFDQPPTPGVLVLLSVYNVSGEFAVRAELDHVAGSVRDATAAHGFTGLAWPDERTTALP
jgi:hypothetical protein